MKLAIDQIFVSDKTRTRARVDMDTVDEYAQMIENGAIFPACVVFAEKGSQRWYLSDGEHRILACQKLGKKTIGVEVKEGGVHEALHYALSANTTHGRRRTNEDKNHCVKMALADPFYDNWSLRDIAELCVVSKDLVRKIKQQQNSESVFKDKIESSSQQQPSDNMRPRRPPPTQNELDRKRFEEAVDVIRLLPYDGAAGYVKLELLSIMEKVNHVIDWLTEALTAHVDTARGDSNGE